MTPGDPRGAQPRVRRRQQTAPLTIQIILWPLSRRHISKQFYVASGPIGKLGLLNGYVLPDVCEIARPNRKHDVATMAANIRAHGCDLHNVQLQFQTSHHQR